MTFKNILVPIDLEDENTWEKPRSAAIEYAGWADAKVHVMNVIPTEMMKMSVVAQGQCQSKLA